MPEEQPRYACILPSGNLTVHLLMTVLPLGTVIIQEFLPESGLIVTGLADDPGPAVATIHSRTLILNQVAPAARVGSLAGLSIPMGLILAVPWIANLYWTKVRKSEPRTDRHT